MGKNLAELYEAPVKQLELKKNPNNVGLERINTEPKGDPVSMKSLKQAQASGRPIKNQVDGAETVKSGSMSNKSQESS